MGDPTNPIPGLLLDTSILTLNGTDLEVPLLNLVNTGVITTEGQLLLSDVNPLTPEQIGAIQGYTDAFQVSSLSKGKGFQIPGLENWPVDLDGNINLQALPEGVDLPSVITLYNQSDASANGQDLWAQIAQQYQIDETVTPYGGLSQEQFFQTLTDATKNEELQQFALNNHGEIETGFALLALLQTSADNIPDEVEGISLVEITQAFQQYNEQYNALLSALDDLLDFALLILKFIDPFKLLLLLMAWLWAIQQQSLGQYSFAAQVLKMLSDLQEFLGPILQSNTWTGPYERNRKQKGLPPLPPGWAVHHRIPRRVRDKGYSGWEGLDFDDPDNLRGVKTYRTGDHVHGRITTEWEKWLDAHPPDGPTPTTPEEIEEFARYIDEKYKDEWWESRDNPDDSNGEDNSEK